MIKKETYLEQLTCDLVINFTCDLVINFKFNNNY